MFSTDVQSRLDRLAQIQQEIFTLQKEAEALLGLKKKEEPAEGESQPKRVKRGGKALATRKAERVIIYRALEDLKLSHSSFSAGALMALCRDGRGIKPNNGQVAAIIRWALRRGEIEEVGKNELGEDHYRQAVPRVGASQSPQSPTFHNSIFQK